MRTSVDLDVGFLRLETEHPLHHPFAASGAAAAIVVAGCCRSRRRLDAEPERIIGSRGIATEARDRLVRRRASCMYGGPWPGIQDDAVVTRGLGSLARRSQLCQ